MKYIITTISFLLLSHIGFACDCFGPQKFCDFVFNGFGEPSLVVKATKIRDVDHGMDLQIEQVIKGDETLEVIRVWGDVGHLCRMYTSGFIVGEEYLFALTRIEQENIGWPGDWADKEQIGDYIISVCGKSFWSCDDAINGGETAEEIEACFNKELSLCGRKSANTVESEFCNIKTSEVFPNPSNNLCFINFEDEISFSEGSVRIFDSCGKQVFSTNDIHSIFNSRRLSLNVSNLQSGIYFVDLEIPNACEGHLTRKFMVRN